jgi:fructose transport system substrate-binding protein
MKKLLAGTALALIAMAGTLQAQEATEGEATENQEQTDAGTGDDAAAGGAAAGDLSACLITKTETNPFFVKMREGAEAAAAANGITLFNYAGREDGDHESQVAAVETCIANDVDGILIVPSDSSAMVSTVQQARDAGILVITLDTPLNPIDAADATLATDNFRAGELIGQWAAAQLGDEAANAKIAFLDLDVAQPTVDVLRNQGLPDGLRHRHRRPQRDRRRERRAHRRQRRHPRQRGGRPPRHGEHPRGEPGRERRLRHQRARGRRRLPGAAGHGHGGRRADRGGDGGCAGVQNVADGVIGATAQQYPLDMAKLGIEAVAKYAADGTLPENTEGKEFFDTGVRLVTDKPVEGVESISVEEGMELCWG